MSKSTTKVGTHLSPLRYGRHSSRHHHRPRNRTQLFPSRLCDTIDRRINLPAMEGKTPLTSRLYPSPAHSSGPSSTRISFFAATLAALFFPILAPGVVLGSGVVLGQTPAPPVAVPTRQAPEHPASEHPAPAAPARTQPRFTILLDAAHGGDDTGGQIATSVSEKAVTLALSVRLRSLLAARGISVTTTRESNLTLDADTRAQIANRAQPAACLILHATESGSGVHLFTSAIAATQPTRFLAWKTAQSAYIARSLRLAGDLNAAFQKGAETILPATLARATLPGLDSLACPAVVLELAPERASDNSIAADVTDPAYQAQVAETVAAAILSWKTDWDIDHPPGHASDRLPDRAVIQTPLAAGDQP